MERAAAKEQNHFERFIPSDHYPVLVDIYRNKGIQLDSEAQAMMQSMLFNITVLEYERLDDDQQWKYVNPPGEAHQCFSTKLFGISNLPSRQILRRL